MNEKNGDFFKIPVNCQEASGGQQQSDNSPEVDISEEDLNNLEVSDIEETEESSESGENSESKNLMAEIAKKEKYIGELEEQVKRLYADFDNFRTRKEAETAAAKKYAAERIVTEFLPIMDNFERAVDVSEKTSNYQALKEGLDMVSRQIWEMLKKEGLCEIESVGKVFDPQLHQVVQCEHSDEFDDDTVLRELLKGYKFHDRIIRPSMVIVSRS